MWHRVAPELAHRYRVICPDLRGYGRSWKPDPGPGAYTKRAMGGDLFRLMDRLGHDRFLILAHDRGARVAHRMAADHPDRVAAFVALDIAPTREMYREARSGFAHDYWHWYWLTRPAPFPERLIGADPDFFWLSKVGGASAGMAPFARPALEEYLDAFRDPAAIRGACEDYRAAATEDIAHDDAETGKCSVPMLALWGSDGAIAAHFDCLALWRERVAGAEGRERSDFAPDVPTAAELGYDVTMSSLRGVVAPAGLDPEVAATLTSALAAVNENPDFQKMMAEQGNPIVFAEGADYAAIAAAQSEVAASIWNETPWK
ncbi:alpha/beta fold hydrolase [Mangrovicoccus ximenensis]|uniref:alpha/beta fold hydrolase n=1 Tax=Mangrovicoccus ximenensis TaxID=1911570 RepID=UPI000D356675|nr:alpha/beta fold hydrolase [Mangrovicoccus ximenensis]